jgi:hypothetical protein
MSRKLIPVFLILFLPLYSLGQLKPMIYYYKEKSVIRTFQKNTQSKDNAQLDYKPSVAKIGDTLFLKVEGFETIAIKFTFNLENGFCNYQSVMLSCDSCSINHVQEVLNDKYYHWKKVNENKFLSNYATHTEMEIVRENELCREIIYRFVDKPKKEYKSVYDAL